jgi:hypothetical protein
VRRRAGLLVYATASAAREAASVPESAVLENEVSRAIVAGRVKLAANHGTVTGDTWQATVVRTEARVRSRPRRPRAWLVLDIHSTSTEGGS